MYVEFGLNKWYSLSVSDRWTVKEMTNGLRYILCGQLQKDIQTIMISLERINKEEIEIMATLQDVDTVLNSNDATLSSLSSVVSNLDTLAAQLVTDVQALAAKTAPDASPEVAHINQQAQTLSNLVSAINTAVSSVVSADQAAGGSETPPAPQS